MSIIFKHIEFIYRFLYLKSIDNNGITLLLPTKIRDLLYKAYMSRRISEMSMSPGRLVVSASPRKQCVVFESTYRYISDIQPDSGFNPNGHAGSSVEGVQA